MDNIENNTVIEDEEWIVNLTKNNKLADIGFILMLAGPAIILIADLLTGSIGTVSEITANIICWIAIVLPGIGAVLSIISLFMWKKTGTRGHAFAIITVIMCNPFFYFVYIVICGMASKTLAGLSWM